MGSELQHVGDGQALTTAPQEVMTQSPLFSADVQPKLYRNVCKDLLYVCRSGAYTATFGQMLNLRFV